MAGFSRRGTQLITGAVTVNVLIDWLDGFEVLLRPEETTRTISWIIAPHDAKLADPFPENEMLFLLHIEDVEKTLASKPLSAGLLVLRKNEPFSVRRLPFDMAFLRRLIVIRAPMDIEDVADLELLSMLQLRFFEMYQWTRELQGVIDRKGSQQDLIDATENVLGNYLDVNDSTYSLIAFTKHIEAADMLSKELQTLGCHPKFRIDYLEQKNILEAWREQKAVEVFAPDEICSVPYMTKIMRQEGEYRGHVVMVCNNVKPSAGLIDLFSFFAAYCEKLDAILSDHCAQHPQPVIDFLTRVLTSNRLSQEYIGNQLLILGMDDDCEYRVVVLDAQTSRHSDNVALLISEFSAAIPHAIAFFHENRIVVLFHGTKFDREIALRDRNPRPKQRHRILQSIRMHSFRIRQIPRDSKSPLRISSSDLCAEVQPFH